MSTPTYWIQVDTYWKHSTSYFVGPFASRDEARSWHQNDDWTPQDNVWLSTSQCGGDIRDAWRIYPEPLTKTEARRHGLRRYEDRDQTDTTIAPTTRPNAQALGAAARAQREQW